MTVVFFEVYHLVGVESKLVYNRVLMREGIVCGSQLRRKLVFDAT